VIQAKDVLTYEARGWLVPVHGIVSLY